MRAVGLKIDYVPLRHIVGKAGLMIDGDWVESKDQDPDGDIRLLQLADIGVGDFLDRSSRYMTSSKANQLKCTYLQKGDILVARMPDPIGRACQFPGGSQPCVTVVDICVLRPDSNVADPRYVTYILNSSDVKNQLDRFVKGATRQRISRTNLEQIPIPLPPLQEQNRIAAILDQADALRAKRREALAQLDSLTQSIFIEMFGDPATNPMGWPESTTLGEAAEIISGVTKGRSLNGKATRIVPYLAVANVQDKSLNLSVVKEIDATEDEIKRYLLKKNDLLLTEGGDPDKLGRGTLWNDELPECIHQNHIFRVRLTTEKLTPLFLNWLVGSQRGKKYFLRSAKQTTGIASINMTQLRGFPLLLPPVELQQHFIRVVRVVEKQKIVQRNALVELDALFSTLQHRAFRGEL